jgi:hypothetical protein
VLRATSSCILRRHALALPTATDSSRCNARAADDTRRSSADSATRGGTPARSDARTRPCFRVKSGGTASPIIARTFVCPIELGHRPTRTIMGRSVAERTQEGEHAVLPRMHRPIAAEVPARRRYRRGWKTRRHSTVAAVEALHQLESAGGICSDRPRKLPSASRAVGSAPISRAPATVKAAFSHAERPDPGGISLTI